MLEPFGGKLVTLTCFQLHSQCTVMTLTTGRSTHYPPHMYSAPLQHFITHSNKNCPISESFFTHPLKCCSSTFYITWSFLSMPAWLHLLSVAHPSRIHAWTLHILAQYGILFGAVLPPFSHVHGWLFIQICPVLSRGRWRIVFKGGYRTHFSPLPSIAFHYSYVLCWYLSKY